MSDFYDDTKESGDSMGDDTLFIKAMHDVVPLSPPNRVKSNKHRTLPAVPVPRKQTFDIINSDDDTSSASALVSLEPGDDWSFARPGVSHQTLKRLRRGYWPIQANLDLHGFTRDVAQQELAIFLTECIEQQLRCIRVIHGKGLSSPNRDSVLKKQVGYWLAQHPNVMAFYQAKPSDGGSGAVLVLLQIKK